jgi:hypothetical protein
MAETLIQYSQMVEDLAHQGIVEIFVQNSAVIPDLHFIDLQGSLDYQFNAEASLGGVGSRNLNQDYPDAAKTTGTATPVKEGTVILGGEVMTDRQLLATRQTRIAQKTKAAANYFTRLFFEGDSAAGEFDGLRKRCTNARLRYADGAGTAGGILDLDVLMDMTELVPGDDAMKRLYMSYKMRILLGAIARAQASTRVEYAQFGNQIIPVAFNGIKIVKAGEDENRNFILDFNEKVGNPQAGGSSVTASIYCVGLGGNVDGENLQGLARRVGGKIFEIDPQGVRGTQDITLVEGRMGLATHHDRCIQRYAGILQGISLPAAPGGGD